MFARFLSRQNDIQTQFVQEMQMAFDQKAQNTLFSMLGAGLQDREEA